MSPSEELADHLRQFNLAPFLFIGSGLSRRYLGLESWEDLLRRFSTLTSQPYEFYTSKAEGKFPLIATEIANNFHGIWWSSNVYEKSRETYKNHASQGLESALKIEVAKYLKERSNQEIEDILLAEELNILRNVVIDGVITTNWDLLLESLFPDYQVFIGQNQLLFSTPQQIGEIYKIHGCCTEPNSLVLTEQDYKVFNNRNPYLVAKLLTIFIEHPIVFLGYSLTDANIVSMIVSILDCLTTANIDQLQNRLIFVQYQPEAKEMIIEQSLIVSNDKQVPVISVKTNSFAPVYLALTQTRRRFPARLLRELKEHVYELVANNDPQSKLHVLDIESEANISDLEVVFGVGQARNEADSTLRKVELPSLVGYRGMTRSELLKNTVVQAKEYDPISILNETIPRLLRYSSYVPFYKYLSEASLLDEKGAILDKKLDGKILKEAKRGLEKFRPSNFTDKTLESIRNSFTGVEQMAKEEEATRVIHLATCLDEFQLSSEELKVFILENLELLSSSKAHHKTNFGKLICLYDYLKYKRKR